MPGTTHETQNGNEQNETQHNLKRARRTKRQPPTSHHYSYDNLVQPWHENEEKENLHQHMNGDLPNGNLSNGQAPQIDVPKSPRALPLPNKSALSINSDKPSKPSKKSVLGWYIAGIVSFAATCIGIAILTGAIVTAAAVSGPVGWSMIIMGIIGCLFSGYKVDKNSAANTAAKAPKAKRVTFAEPQEDHTPAPRPSAAPAPQVAHQVTHATISNKKPKHKKARTLTYVPIPTKNEEKENALHARLKALEDEIANLQGENERLKQASNSSSASDAAPEALDFSGPVVTTAAPPPPEGGPGNYYEEKADPLKNLKDKLNSLSPEERAARLAKIATEEQKAKFSSALKDAVTSRIELTTEELEMKIQSEKKKREQQAPSNPFEFTLNNRFKNANSSGNAAASEQKSEMKNGSNGPTFTAPKLPSQEERTAAIAILEAEREAKKAQIKAQNNGSVLLEKMRSKVNGHFANGKGIHNEAKDNDDCDFGETGTLPPVVKSHYASAAAMFSSAPVPDQNNGLTNPKAPAKKWDTVQPPKVITVQPPKVIKVN